MKPYIENRINGAIKKMLGAFGVASDLFGKDINWQTTVAGNIPKGFIATFADAGTGAVLHREIIGVLATTQEPYIDRASKENIDRLSRFNVGNLISSTQCSNGLAHYGTIRVNQMPEPVIVSVGGLAGPFDHLFACIGGIWIADDAHKFQDEVVPKLMGNNSYWKRLNEYESEKAIFNIAF